jgi:hypothetical protein
LRPTSPKRKGGKTLNNSLSSVNGTAVAECPEALPIQVWPCCISGLKSGVDGWTSKAFSWTWAFGVEARSYEEALGKATIYMNRVCRERPDFAYLVHVGTEFVSNPDDLVIPRCEGAS